MDKTGRWTLYTALFIIAIDNFGFALCFSLFGPLILEPQYGIVSVVFGYLITAALLLLSISTPWILAFVFIYIFSALFCNIAFSNNMTLISTSAPANIQGKIMGLSQSMMSLGWFGTPIIGGIVGKYALSLTYPISAFLVFLSFILLFWKSRTLARSKKGSS